jgi:hypothetical protein
MSSLAKQVFEAHERKQNMAGDPHEVKTGYGTVAAYIGEDVEPQ